MVYFYMFIYGQIEYHEPELTAWDKYAQIVLKQMNETVVGFVALMAKYQLICNRNREAVVRFAVAAQMATGQ